MRTEDFSRAPDFAAANEVFFGGTHYTGIWSIIRLGFRWPRFRRRMEQAPGYLDHRLWYRFPYTIGTISWWSSRQDLMMFARSTAHRAAVDWVMSPGVARAAFIRFLTPRPTGHTLGEWTAVSDGSLREITFPSSTDELAPHEVRPNTTEMN